MSDTENKMALLARKEEDDWQLYLKIYSIKTPKPKKKKFFNWRFVLALVGAVGAVAFSAFRNSGSFFTIAERADLPDWAVWGEAISGVAAVNLLLVSLSLLLSYKKRNVSDFSMKVGVGIALLIGALAGLSQAFLGLEMDHWVGGINFCLAIAVGVGVTALEWLGGDMLGVELVRYEEFTKENEQAYQTELRTWESNARHGFGSWLANKERKLSTQTEPQTNVPIVRTTNRQTRTNSRTSNSESGIVRLLEDTYANEQRLLGVSELAGMLANELGLIKRDEHGTVTNYDELKEFVNQKKGYISQVRTRWANAKGVA